MAAADPPARPTRYPRPVPHAHLAASERVRRARC